MQKQALIKLFLFLTATSQAAPLNAGGNLAARGSKDLLDLKIDLSPVSGLPVADPAANAAGLARRQNYGTAPATKAASTEPSYGATEPAAEDEGGDVDSASDDSDSDDEEPAYGAEESDSDSDSESDDEEEEETTDGGAEGAEQGNTDSTPAAGGSPSYGASPVDTSAGPINPPFALPPVDLDSATDKATDVVSSTGEEVEKSTTSTTGTTTGGTTEGDKPAEEKEATDGASDAPAYGATNDAQKSAESTEGETAAPSYGAAGADKAESTEGETAGPSYA